MYSRKPYLRASSSSVSSRTLVGNASVSSGSRVQDGSVVSDTTIATTGGIDPQTDALIAQLLYDDLKTLLGTRKGKARSGAPLNDADYALQLQSEQLERMLTEVQDVQIAASLSRALSADQEIINALALSEKVAQQDRAAALALSRGGRLPELTKEQRAMESGVLKDDTLVSDDILVDLSPDFKSPAVSLSYNKGKGKATFAFEPLTPSVKLPPVERPHCVGCDDKVPLGKLYLKAPCDHTYCADCLVSLVRAATTDESLFPVRCCKKNIPTENITKFLSHSLHALFKSKSHEFGTPAQARVYCYVPTCSAFLGNAEEAAGDQASWAWVPFSIRTTLRCDKCRVETCTKCRQRAHPNDACQRNTSAQLVRELARAQGWQTCPQCSRIIELSTGCNHMTCYCGYEFCYECAAKWKVCGCAQWEEARLYATAEARMERELGGQLRVQRPIEFQREVRAFAQNLRVNHDCYPNHRWRGHGPGECEECGMYMPKFLKMCKECRLTVCRRCSFNRL